MEIRGKYKYGTKTVHNDGTIEIYIPKLPFDTSQPPPDTTPVDKRNWSKEQIEERERENIDRSTRRARKSVKNHVKNNSHTHFINFTYKPTYDNERRFKRSPHFL